MNKDWHLKRLGDVIRLEYGKPLPESDRIENGAHPAYGANGEKARTNRYLYDKTSIIVGRKGSAGEINLTEEKFWALDVTYYVTYDEHEMDVMFIYYLLKTLNLPGLAKGVKPGINRNEVYAQEVRIPDLTEQMRVVESLEQDYSAIAKALKLTQRKLHALHELRHSILAEAFYGKPLDETEG